MNDAVPVWRRVLIFIAYSVLGAFIGVFLLHPASMFILDYHGQTAHFNWNALQMAFSVEHMHMAVFFSLLGITVSLIYGKLIEKLTIAVRRMHILESILPICCVCKRIKSEAFGETKTEEWMGVADYFYGKIDNAFSHGYCPDCY